MNAYFGDSFGARFNPTIMMVTLAFGVFLTCTQLILRAQPPMTIARKKNVSYWIWFGAKGIGIVALVAAAVVLAALIIPALLNAIPNGSVEGG